MGYSSSRAPCISRLVEYSLSKVWLNQNWYRHRQSREYYRSLFFTCNRNRNFTCWECRSIFGRILIEKSLSNLTVFLTVSKNDCFMREKMANNPSELTLCDSMISRNIFWRLLWISKWISFGWRIHFIKVLWSLVLFWALDIVNRQNQLISSNMPTRPSISMSSRIVEWSNGRIVKS